MYTHRKGGLFTFSETCVEPAVTIYCGCLAGPEAYDPTHIELVQIKWLINLWVDKVFE